MPIKPHSGAQNVGQQMLVWCDGSVDGCETMIARGLALRHDFETGQMNLTQRTLVHNGIRRHASQLLGVSGEVLGAGGGRGLMRVKPAAMRPASQVLG